MAAPSATPAGPALPTGFRLLAFDELGSTNDEAKQLAREGAAQGTVIWTRRQLSGRGRRGRAWSSPEGNLAASIVLRPKVTPNRAAQLSFVAALGVGDVMADVLPTGAEVRFKWPNDVLVTGRKAAGILLESEPNGDASLAWLVVGVGINVRHHPTEVKLAATSLCAEGAMVAEPLEVLVRFVHRFDRWAERWRAEGFAPIRDAWLARASGLGEPVTVRLDLMTLRGRFAGLDREGALLLDMDGGEQRRITAGDVFSASG
jgi:BirA family biotin operon repressor/biotin-[acetyl-CoA-carboxylase] ligase